MDSVHHGSQKATPPLPPPRSPVSMPAPSLRVSCSAKNSTPQPLVPLFYAGDCFQTETNKGKGWGARREQIQELFFLMVRHYSVPEISSGLCAE